MRNVKSIPMLPPPTKNPAMKPLVTKAESILLSASMKMTIMRGDNGSPYLRPQKLLKKSIGLSFTKTENFTVDMHYLFTNTIYLQIHPSQASRVRNPN